MYGVICLLLFGSVHICSDLVLFEDHVSFSRSFYGVRYGNLSGSKIVFIRFDQRNISRLILGLIFEAQGVGECIVSNFLCFVFDLTIQIHFITIIFSHNSIRIYGFSYEQRIKNVVTIIFFTPGQK